MEATSLDFPLPPPTPTQEFSSPITTFPSPTTTIAPRTATNSAIVIQHHHQNPMKKRAKLLPNSIDTQIGISTPSSSHQGGISPNRPKPKKPDPSAPKITRPCSECGKKFWSWKALFGHMRCHPERQWRGINPPPQFRREASPQDRPGFYASMTEEDHEGAACLLLLANGSDSSNYPTIDRACEFIGGAKQVSTVDYPHDENFAGEVLMITSGVGHQVVEGAGPSSLGCRFECSSCKKTFGSHQALGGHRASHKNVKGCFAITRNEIMPMVVAKEEDAMIEGVDGDGGGGGGGGENMMLVLGGHRCSICPRVFPTGQALGGHMRCHWERIDQEPMLGIPRGGGGGCALDLNLPAPWEDGFPSCCSSDLHLELKLGI
ncbi:hypothetical protein Dimus_002531 [Dionaea muscipula]